MRRAAVGAASWLLLACTTPAAVIYVDCDATSGANDGSSWTDAFADLQDALAAPSLVSGDEIWVAEGIYKPTDTGDRMVSFALVEGVALYGGFSGTESARDERVWVVHETVLSGDLAGDDGPDFANYGENSYHVVLGASDATLDGFTVTRGNADDSPCGAGMYNYNLTGLTVANCTFSGNRSVIGGGMYNSFCSPAVADCTFSGNWARALGGGMYSGSDSSPAVTGCTFSGNTADEEGGGMRISLDSSPTVSDCTFLGNWVRYRGGGISNYQASPHITDCTFTGNTARWGGGMSDDNFTATSYPSVTNCMFSSNTADFGGGGIYSYCSSATITSCIFSGNTAGWDGGGGMYGENGSSPVVVNCVFAGNLARGSGGGVFGGYASNTTVTGCVLWGNSAASSPEAFAHTDYNSSCTVSYSIIAQPDGFTDGGGNFDFDPMFVDPGHWDDNGTPGDDTDDIWVDGDYHLQAGSPCIDRADGDAAPEFDIEGNARHDDPGMPDAGRGSPDYVDIGAYEFQGHSRITPFAGGCGVTFGGHVPIAHTERNRNMFPPAALALVCLTLARRRRYLGDRTARRRMPGRTFSQPL